MASPQLRARHLVDVVEKAYSLEGPDDRWLDAVLEAAHLDFDLGFGTYAFPCRIVDERLELGGAFAHRELSPSYLSLVAKINEDVPPEATRTLARVHAVCASHEKFFGSEHPSVSRFKELANPAGFVDAMSLFVQDSEGNGVNMTAPSAATIEIHPRVSAMWRRVGTHIVAGLRLRRRLSAHALRRDALLDDRGKLQDLDAALHDDTDGRRTLIGAATQIDRARSSKGRRDPERALDLWQGLVAGRWSLVDHWEKGGRRYIAAYQNTPEVADPRALSLQERSIVRSLWLGASNKEIAFNLGVPFASVATSVRRILKKLRCRRREDLVALGDPASWHVVSTSVGGGELRIATSPRRGLPLTELTATERSIVERVVAGDTNMEIARRRKTSVNTVANQLQAIYRQLGVHSRAELIRRLA